MAINMKILKHTGIFTLHIWSFKNKCKRRSEKYDDVIIRMEDAFVPRNNKNAKLEQTQTLEMVSVIRVTSKF